MFCSVFFERDLARIGTWIVVADDFNSICPRVFVTLLYDDAVLRSFVFPGSGETDL